MDIKKVKETLKKIVIIVSLILITGCANITAQQYLSKKYSKNIDYKKSSFEDLANWDSADQLESFNTFKKSCEKILEENKLEYSNWINICHKVINTDLKTKQQAKLFFEQNFTPYQIIYKGKDTGLFTGYYEPSMKGSLVKTMEYTVPIYRTPDNLVKKPKDDDSFSFGMYQDGKFVPYYSREEISKGDLLPKKDVLVWVKSKVDRTFLQIQGSGRIETDSGDILIGYDSQNGHEYKPIGKYLLDHGYMSATQMSMQAIKAWLDENKDKIDDVLNYDPSFVFFRYIDRKNAVGAQDVELTPGYSLAVDNKYYLYGVPLWLETDYFADNHDDTKPLDRLMIAQDTGGAIKGAIRSDVFWGHGKQAEFNAGHMNNRGKLWILLPND
ncbi:murein transglycosylase A [Francisella tularensis]|uniref:murein transglycosylase A n=1 Tax=Francisella tularensis TaxID=263 RepID=UPI0000F59072|nr:murein transglycosylase A [Francisella tularensis]ABO46478.1 membrane-bound lytic murein transglycosylase A (MLT) family protein [Francisella tularensis subsp. tularensis WY96-3418]AJI63997.1 mltA specific insert domain protein [Francisella tularensis subsp. tularensis]AKH91615.1 murein transglycosylase [Francisella tularensis subsp. tularensis WY-00W4114]AKU72767.1 mltA specific insert domain protein [Francisella tularensis subsp. tularensis]EKM87754.1 membrane-bound lytic murein transglyc